MNTLTGTWVYTDCRIKNTSVKGTLSFYKNGKFCIEVKMREDHPTPPLSIIKGSYRVTGNQVKYSNIEFDHAYYHPHPIGPYFYIKNNYLYFSHVRFVQLEKTILQKQWIYKLINSRIRKLFIKEYKDPLIFEHTPPPHTGIPGLCFYRVLDNALLFSGKSAQSKKWIVTAGYEVLKANRILEVLETMHYIPQSNQEAIRTALLILDCCNEGLTVLCNLPHKSIQDYREEHNIKQEIIDKLIIPQVNKKEGYIDVILYGYYNIKGALFQFEVKTGKNVYKWDKKIYTVL